MQPAGLIKKLYCIQGIKCSDALEARQHEVAVVYSTLVMPGSHNSVLIFALTSVQTNEFWDPQFKFYE